MKKIYGTILLFVFILFITSFNVLAVDINMDLNNNIENNIDNNISETTNTFDNLENNNVIENSENTEYISPNADENMFSYNEPTASSYKMSTASTSEDFHLTVSNVIDIILISVSLVLILLAIAILIRLKNL